MTGLAGIPNPAYKSDVEKALDELTEAQWVQEYAVYYHLSDKGLLPGHPNKGAVMSVVRRVLNERKQLPANWCGPTRSGQVATALKVAKFTE